jgi:hypothetical protein
MIAESRANNPGATADFNDSALRELRDETPSVSPVLAALPKIAAAGVTCLGFAVLLGWMFGIEPLKSVLPGLETMKPITAVTFILSGILLYLSGKGVRSASYRRARTILSLFIIALGIFTLIGFASLVDFRLFIARGWSADATKPMSVLTALQFALLGAAMLVAQRSHGNDLAFVALTFVGMLISLLVCTGYLYNLPILYEPVAASSIALHEGVAFFVLYVGAAMTRPNTGWVALLAPDSITGAFAPWLLPGIVILPIGLGWVLNQGIKSSVITAESSPID